MPVEKLKIRATLGEARAAFEKNLGLIFGLTLVYAALDALSSLIGVAGAAGPAISLGITLLLGAGYGGLITVVICIPDKNKSFSELWSQVSPVLARLIWVTLIVAIAVLAGLVALIFPGLIIATIWSVAGQVIVVERLGAFASLGRSFNLVRNTAWQVFGYLVLVLLISLMVFALAALASAPLPEGTPHTVLNTFLTSLLAAPVLGVATAQLYLQLTRNAEKSVEESTDSLGGPDSD